jgi:hypothetical protein
MDMDLWSYSKALDPRTDLDGFDVVALDGEIGTIDEATDDVGDSYIVVDTGPWIFGRKVVIPAKAIVRLDPPEHSVFLRLTKDQIKDSPELNDPRDADRRRQLIGSYYGPIF